MQIWAEKQFFRVIWLLNAHFPKSHHTHSLCWTQRLGNKWHSSQNPDISNTGVSLTLLATSQYSLQIKLCFKACEHKERQLFKCSWLQYSMSYSTNMYGYKVFRPSKDARKDNTVSDSTLIYSQARVSR